MLLNLFEFGDEDLAMNRRGLMTARQTEWGRDCEDRHLLPVLWVVCRFWHVLDQ